MHFRDMQDHSAIPTISSLRATHGQNEVLFLMRTKWVLLVCLLAVSMATAQQTPPPIIFFTDLIAGPASGNSDTTYGSTGGVYVTLYGNFLDNFTSVQLNNASCLTVVSNPTAWRWYERMVVKLGTACTSGNFSITTASGTWSGPTVATSNGATLYGGPSIDFTVAASGHIYYVATSGNDGSAGSFSSPWRTIPHGVQTAGTTSGNVIYVESGVTAAVEDGQSWGAALTMRPDWSLGTRTSPNALVAYPGVTNVQIGCNSANCNPNYGLRCVDTDAWTVSNRGYWTIAGINFRSGGGGGPIQVAGGELVDNYQSKGWRLVANDVSSPNSNNTTAFQLNLTDSDQVLGNYIHDVVLLTTSRLDQAFYLSTDSNKTEVGWNEIYNNKGRGGLQSHSSNLCYPSCNGDKTGFALHDIWIHDNKVHHINEEGLLVDTVDPSVGNGVRVYNNVVYDCAVDGNGDCMHHQLSGDYTSSSSYYAGMGMTNPDYGNSPPPLWWYNNTVYATGGNGTFGNWWPDVHVSGQTVTDRVANNIFYSGSASVPYLDPEDYTGAGCSNSDTFSACGTESGTTNLMYGNGSPTFPNLYASSLNVNPQFLNLSGFDFHLQSGSPAIGAGLHSIVDKSGTKSITAPTYDIDGRVRPNPPSVGAYEYGSTTVTKPNPPTNLSATVQ